MGLLQPGPVPSNLQVFWQTALPGLPLFGPAIPLRSLVGAWSNQPEPPARFHVGYFQIDGQAELLWKFVILWALGPWELALPWSLLCSSPAVAV